MSLGETVLFILLLHLCGKYIRINLHQHRWIWLQWKFMCCKQKKKFKSKNWWYLLHWPHLQYNFIILILLLTFSQFPKNFFYLQCNSSSGFLMQTNTILSYRTPLFLPYLNAYNRTKKQNKTWWTFCTDRYSLYRISKRQKCAWTKVNTNKSYNDSRQGIQKIHNYSLINYFMTLCNMDYFDNKKMF